MSPTCSRKPTSNVACSTPPREMVKPGGTLVYCVCSLAREEGEDVVEAFLNANPTSRRNPLSLRELRGEAQFVTAAGDLRTLPSHWAESRRP